MDSIQLASDRDQWRTSVNILMNLCDGDRISWLAELLSASHGLGYILVTSNKRSYLLSNPKSTTLLTNSVRICGFQASVSTGLRGVFANTHQFKHSVPEDKKRKFRFRPCSC